MERSKLREVIVLDEDGLHDYVGRLHHFGVDVVINESGTFQIQVGVVEKEDGHIELVPVEFIKFNYH